MNNVQKINYGPLGAELRIIVDGDQKIWFVASDIAKILEYRDAPALIRGLDDDEQSTQKVCRLNGHGSVDMSVITESGLYHVILNAKTERVKPFRRWVTEEVLPQIRKTGSYSTRKESGENTIAYYLDISDRLGRCGFSKGVQQAYLLEEDQKLFDATATHLLPELARIEARQEVAKITFDRSEDTNFACCIPVSDFKTFTTTELARKFNDKRVTSKVINDWLCDGKFQKRISPRKYMKLDRGRDVATTRHTYSGETRGLDIVSGWRYTAEVQRYLESRYRELR